MKSVHTHTYTLPVSWKKANEAHWNFLRFWLVSHNCSTASNPNSCASYGPSCSTVQLHCRIRLLQMWKWGKTSLKLVQNPIWMMPLITNINGKQQDQELWPVFLDCKCTHTWTQRIPVSSLFVSAPPLSGAKVPTWKEVRANLEQTESLRIKPQCFYSRHSGLTRSPPG